MRPGLIKQPANTWSNLGFVMAGIAIAAALSSPSYRRRSNLLTRSELAATLFSCVVVLLGPGSMAMHASGTRMGALFDNVSMYLVAGFLVAYSSVRLFRLRSPWLLPLFAGVFAMQLVSSRYRVLPFIPRSSGNTAFALCLTTTIVFEAIHAVKVRTVRSHGWGYASVASVAVAFTIWNLSLTGRPCCVRDSLLQGHALWHLLCALSVYCLFRYLVSEDLPV
jgi:hypothetical protein